VTAWKTLASDNVGAESNPLLADVPQEKQRPGMTGSLITVIPFDDEPAAGGELRALVPVLT